MRVSVNQSLFNPQEEITTSSEAEALAEIVNWSSTKLNWMRDALRKLYMEGKLVDSTIHELYRLCKDGSPTLTPFTSDDIRDPTASTAPVALTGIKNVKNINALADNQKLPFSPQGMTIRQGTMPNCITLHFSKHKVIIVSMESSYYLRA